MYTVTFDANGGTVDEATRKVVKGRAIGELPVPARSGYTFDGWFTRAGTLITETAKVSGDFTLYAHWTLAGYMVTFNANGGAVDEATRVVPKGQAIGEMPVPVRGGYTFDGWYTKAGTRITETARVSADFTLYAHWNLAGCTVTFNANGGAVDEVTRVVPKGQAIGEMPMPVRSGYTFDGWYTKAGTRITETARVSADFTLYAHWTMAGYTVTFNANGGTVDETIRKVAKGQAIGEMPVPVRSGYTFDGWYTKAGTRITETARVSADVMLYARWATQVCVVTFDPVGGTVGEPTRRVAKGATIGKMPVPVRNGYTFDGWRTKAGTLITETAKVSGDVTLYARWTR